MLVKVGLVNEGRLRLLLQASFIALTQLTPSLIARAYMRPYSQLTPHTSQLAARSSQLTARRSGDELYLEDTADASVPPVSCGRSSANHYEGPLPEDLCVQPLRTRVRRDSPTLQSPKVRLSQRQRARHRYRVLPDYHLLQVPEGNGTFARTNLPTSDPRSPKRAQTAYIF